MLTLIMEHLILTYNLTNTTFTYIKSYNHKTLHIQKLNKHKITQILHLHTQALIN
jgi:hypothetical protein